MKEFLDKLALSVLIAITAAAVVGVLLTVALALWVCFGGVVGGLVLTFIFLFTWALYRLTTLPVR